MPPIHSRRDLSLSILYQHRVLFHVLCVPYVCCAALPLALAMHTPQLSFSGALMHTLSVYRSCALVEPGGLEFPVRRSENERRSIGNENRDLNACCMSMWECVRYLGPRRQSCHP
ncbi:hypothetical protein DAEQUDRAFT_156473 [Daedalea quercina L-15889]|uniref:Uncharacterized protein n=1 Tax=Daedalea quercina L-15889 TaxID=1314783 RepID=A0A165RPN2_9APHY|nr:hypothetical protein DAEQUDRAFT_156473 [Daedalea quercina L-15889]